MILDDGGNKIVFAPMVVWSHFSPNPLLSLIISIPFPIFIYLIYIRRLFTNKILFLSLIVQTVSILIFTLLTNTKDPLNADFLSGVSVAILLTFVVTFICFIDELTRVGIKSIKEKVIAIVGSLMFLLQFIYGSTHYYMLMIGRTSYLSGWLG